jgi:transposase
MPAKNHLSQEQRERLLKMLKQHENPYVREKVFILLLINDGKTYQEISNFLDIAYPTVAYWAVHGDPDNLDSFLDGRREGNFRKITQEYENLLLKIIEKEPAEYGYEFGGWTAARLATHLEKATGIKLSGSQVRRRLEKKSTFTFGQSTALVDKQNPEKRKAFKEKLTEYLRITKENPNRLQVWFWDESGFSLRVIRRKTWGRKGHRKKVTGQRRKGRVNIMGGRRYHDKKRINFVIKKGNAEIFYEQIKQLNNWLLKEWIEQGNKIDDFKKSSAKIVIIIENASFHKKKISLKKLKQKCPT